MQARIQSVGRDKEGGWRMQFRLSNGIPVQDITNGINWMHVSMVVLGEVKLHIGIVTCVNRIHMQHYLLSLDWV